MEYAFGGRGICAYYPVEELFEMEGLENRDYQAVNKRNKENNVLSNKKLVSSTHVTCS